MTNDNNIIRSMIGRFMAGETSRQEEQELAQWFASHRQVDDDLEPYRLMFAYFDNGMPRKAPARRRTPWLYAVLAVAASLALVVTLVWPGAQPAGSPVAMTHRAAPADTLATPTVETDTLPVKEETEKTSVRYRRHRFSPSPPKVLLADADPVAEPLCVSMPTEEPECEDVQLAAWPLSEAERQIISLIGEQQAEEALRQLKLAQRQFLEESIDSIDRQLQLAGVTEPDDEQIVY